MNEKNATFQCKKETAIDAKLMLLFVYMISIKYCVLTSLVSLFQPYSCCESIKCTLSELNWIDQTIFGTFGKSTLTPLDISSTFYYPLPCRRWILWNFPCKPSFWAFVCDYEKSKKKFCHKMICERLLMTPFIWTCSKSNHTDVFILFLYIFLSFNGIFFSISNKLNWPKNEAKLLSN